jgi:membrane protease YdiL (CAAX protease family)
MARSLESEAVLAPAPAEEDAVSLSPRFPWQVRTLELLLLLYAVYSSGALAIWVFAITGGSFSAGWDTGEAWLFFLAQNGGPVGILLYIILVHRPQLLSRPNKKFRWLFEMALVLWTAFATASLHSIMLLFQGFTIADFPSGTSWGGHLQGVAIQANSLAVLAYVLYCNSEGFAYLGLHWSPRDLAATFPLFAVLAVVSSVFRPLTFWSAEVVAGHELILPDISPNLVGPRIYLITVLGLVLNGFFEELIVRAYLMKALRNFTNSTLLPICASVAVQISYHFYQGAPLALSYIGLFSVLAVYYSRTGRILPVILSHILVDLFSLLSYANRLHSGL